MKHTGILLLALCAAALAADLDQRRLDGRAHVYVNFAINCHDWLDPDLSSGAVLRAARGFAKHGVRGDFYITEPLAYAWAEKAPGTIEELKKLGMGFGYHHRPPHPCGSIRSRGGGFCRCRPRKLGARWSGTRPGGWIWRPAG